MFDTELDLVNTITEYLSRNDSTFLDWKRKLFQELDLWYWIADIVIASYSKNNQTREIGLNFFDISILKLIEKSSTISLIDIVDALKSNKQSVKKSLARLEEENFIKFNSKVNAYDCLDNYKIILKDSVAIEAKLKDWKRALKQAYRYKWFSNRSFVFMPEDNIRPAMKYLDLFKKMEVWLVSVDKKNWIKIVYDSKPEKPYCEKMCTLLNEKLISELFIKSF